MNCFEISKVYDAKISKKFYIKNTIYIIVGTVERAREITGPKLEEAIGLGRGEVEAG